MKARKYQLTIVVDPDSSLSLQHQVRQKLVDAMNRGVLRPGRRLPSSRRLAEQVGVSRNTITLAYDALLAEGHLVSYPRSGIFVAPAVQGERLTTGRRGLAPRTVVGDRFATPQGADSGFRRPPNWHQYPYPFLDGCVDPSLVPVEEWREALRLAFAKQDVLRWSAGGAELDDPRFADELRTKVLPSFGIDASPDEIVTTASARHALYLLTETLIERSAPVLLDESVDAEVRRRLRERQVNVAAFEWDGDTARLKSEIAAGAVVLLGSRRITGAPPLTRQRAQALLLAAARSNALIVECASPPDLRESRRAPPPLRALDTEGRVVFVCGLAPVAALGTPPAFINGSAGLIERVRLLRRSMGSELPIGLQRAWAYFIGLGHYAAAIARASSELRDRSTALRDALNHYLHRFVSIRTQSGMSAYWVRGGPALKATELARAAASIGILIEPSREDDASDLFCMGVTSLPKEQIRSGIERLARLVNRDPQLGSRALREETAPVLRGKALQRAMSAATLLYNTVYGEPCTIHLRADGALSGRAGYANDDRDTGRWWIEDDRWFRQWRSWAYGEIAGFYTVIDGDQVRWFNVEGLLVDTAVIVRGRPRRMPRCDP